MSDNASHVPDAPVWNGMTRAALDRAYSPSAMTDGIEPYLARYAAEGRAAYEACPAARQSTHAYGPAPAHTLDLFRPEGGPAPLVLFIHGGYWQALGKGDGAFPAPGLTARGLAFATLDYTLAPAATMDAIVAECRLALRSLWRARAGLGIADRGVVLAGHSAGAHLAAMLLATDWAASGDDPAMIAGALLISGVYDLEPIRLSYVNDAIGMDAVDARRNSPLHLVPRVDVPVVISAAERDTDEFRRQARAFAGAWAQHLGDLVLFTHADRNHFDCLFDWHDPTSRLSRETARLAGL